MDNLETYNRVPSLESPHIKVVLLCMQVFLSVVVIASLSWFFLIERQLSCLALSSFCIMTLLILSKHTQQRLLSCQFCKHPLSYVTRPLLLTPKFLAMEGSKLDNHFYTFIKWGHIPLKQRWAKISNRALTCHHCHLTEEAQSTYYQTATASEVIAATNSQTDNTDQ